MRAISAIIASAALIAALTGTVGAQSTDQQPAASDMPGTPHQQDVLAPARDAAKEAGAQGNDPAAPTPEGAAAAAPDGPCGTGMPATAHQQEVLKTAQDCADQAGSGTTTGPDGVARTQPDNKPVQQPQ